MDSVGWGGERWVRGGKGRKAFWWKTLVENIGKHKSNIVLVVVAVVAETASDCKIYL